MIVANQRGMNTKTSFWVARVGGTLVRIAAVDWGKITTSQSSTSIRRTFVVVSTWIGRMGANAGVATIFSTKIVVVAIYRSVRTTAAGGRGSCDGIDITSVVIVTIERFTRVGQRKTQTSGLSRILVPGKRYGSRPNGISFGAVDVQIDT